MSTDLSMLAYTAILTFALAFPPAIALILAKGLPFAAGNRDEPYELPVWADRAGRAHRNMLENLPIFAALVLIANAAGASNEITAFGATLFFWARVAHAIIYIAGIPWLRTVAFVASLSGLIRITGEIL